jgi:hypothetical protein
MTVEALMVKTPHRQPFQMAHTQARSHRSAGVSFGRLTERCTTPNLMAEREDLERKRRTPPKGSETCGQMSEQRVSGGESKGVTLRLLYCFFATEHGRRKIKHCNVTRHPSADWVIQPLRETFSQAPVMVT